MSDSAGVLEEESSSPKAIRVEWLIVPILLLSAGLYFTGLGGPPVCNPDEGLYAEIPREMIESGEYVIPRCNAARYSDKPPLLAWLTAGLYRAFGVSEFTARFWNAASGVAAVGIVFLLGKAMVDPWTGILAAFIYATSSGTLVFSRFLLLDQMLTTLIAGAILGIWQMLRASDPKRRVAWSMLAGASAGAAVLTKGLLGLAFPAGVMVVALLWDPMLRRGFRWSALGTALLSFLVVALPWHLAAARRDPETIHLLLFNEQINRFLDSREPRDYETLPVPLFLAVSLAWSFPWCFSLPMSAVATWPALRPGTRAGSVPESARSAPRFLAAWIGIVLWFFVVSQCRLAPYSLPALPALALLIAVGWRSRPAEPFPPSRRKLAQACAGLFALGATALLVAGAAFWGPISRFLGSTAIARLGAAILCFIALAAWMAVFSLGKGRRATAVILLGSAAVLLCIGNAVGLAAYQAGRSFDRVVEALPADRDPDSVLVLDHPQEYESVGALCFYSRSRVRVLERPGRPTSPGHHGASERFFLGPDEFRDLWNSGKSVYFISDVDADAAPPVPGLERFRPIGQAQDRRLYSNR